MCVSLSANESRVEPVVGFAVQLETEECDAPVAAGVMSTGV